MMPRFRIYSRFRKSVPLAASLLYLVLFVPTAHAVDLEPLLPAPGEVNAPAPLPDLSAEETPSEEDADLPAAGEVLVDALREVRFDCFKPLPPVSPEVAQPPGTPVPGVVNAVQALGPALASPGSELHKAVRDALAGEFTWGELDALLTAATNAAREFGWSLARAYAPEQELTEGVLRIEVLPVWMDDVAVEGAKWSNAERLRGHYAPFVGRVVHLPDMAGIHAFQNMHPFRTVVPSLTPGKAEGATAYKLAVHEKKPWRVFSGYETTHSRNSGAGRFTGGTTFVAPWRTDDVVTMQYAKDDKFDHLDSFALVYQHALPWRHFLTVTALYSESDSVSDQYFGQTSKDSMLRLAYMVPLPEWRGWTHSLEAGWEWRRSHAKSDFSGANFFDNTYVSAPVFLGWRGRRWDKWGVTALSLDAAVGPGGYLGRMERAVYDANRSGAKRNWFALRPEFRRDWRLPADFIATQRVWAQWSPDRLADSGQFYLGGNRSIRGYRESEVAGDKGVGVSLEVQSPSLTRLLEKRAVKPDESAASLEKAGKKEALPKPEVRLAAFWDWGMSRRNGTLESYEKRSTVLGGAGVGVRVWWGEWLNAQVDYAWRLRDTGHREDDKKNGFLHASVNIGF